ncbi:MAG: cytochrome C, partial [Burkholderiales bacterium]|nr:cytochrome C [Burkholderiales bacterium]
MSPNGEHYYPSFPYTAYTRMTRDDMLALKAYLFSVPPIARKNWPHALAWYVRRPLLWFWKRLYFEPGEYGTNAEKSPE